MFKGLLPENLNVYATTASNATTSSFACYYDKARKTFLGDVYSIKWMEDSDKETLDHQYQVVKKATNTSTVCQFGDKSMGKLMVGEFQGPKETVQNRPPPHPFPGPSTGCGKSAIAGPEVPVEILKKRMEDAENADEAQEAKEMYNTLQKNREFMRNVVKTVVDSVTADAVFTDNVELTKYDCYYAAVDEFHDKCFNVGKNDYALRMLNTFVNLCERGFDVEVI